MSEELSEAPFWETVPLADMSPGQGESLCDGCARCCLHKLQDDYTEQIYYTDVACRLLDQQACRCTRYERRRELVPDCVVLTPDEIGDLGWLPNTCAYRLLSEGRPIPAWHPLVSGDPQSVHLADISVRGFTVSEDTVADEDLEDHIIHWIELD
jgi:uncharacterized cysteine cluster protein YcgN (CxxCxxCC family)